MIPETPLGPVGDRDPAGRFAPGNTAARGNPFAKKAGEFRAALFGAITPADVAEVARSLLASAKAGEGWAVRELLDRLLGKADALDVLERLEALEERLAATSEHRP